MFSFLYDSLNKVLFPGLLYYENTVFNTYNTQNMC